MLKNDLTRIEGLRYVIDDLDIRSSVGRRMLFEREWSVSPSELSNRFDHIEQSLPKVADPRFESLRTKFLQLKDILAVLRLLTEGGILNDTDFFLIKSFILLYYDICGCCEQMEYGVIVRKNLDLPLALLDPDGHRVSTFRIYDSYSDKLRQLRNELKGCPEEDRDRIFELISECEEQIRFRLSAELRQYTEQISSALSDAAYLDIVMAQAEQAIRQGFTRPELAEGDTATGYWGLCQPEVQSSLRVRGVDYQRINVESLGAEPTLLTGANMGGKSVLLQSVALAQVMCQYGFYVAAERAVVALCDAVYTISGDNADSKGGLSSFAAEMLSLNQVVERVSSGERPFVTIDELARTTNPVEGAAIVGAVIKYFSEQGVRSVIATHYGNVDSVCQRLRIRGLVCTEGDVVTAANLQRYFDYQPEPVTTTDVPHEALRIATILGVDEQIIENIKKILTK